MAVSRHLRPLSVLDLYPPFDSWLRHCVNWFLALRTRDWLRSLAVIEKAEVQEIVDEESGAHQGWRPIIRYVYHVNNVAYFGAARGEIWFYDEAAARETAQSLERNKIPIRYKPSCPAKSVYLPVDGAPPQLFPSRPDPSTGLTIISL